MENWPPYWMGLPPMHYATHAVSPLLALAGTRARQGALLRLGRDAPGAVTAQYGNPYPGRDGDLQLGRAQTWPPRSRARSSTRRAGYTESFDVYGEKTTFEWQQIEEEDPVLFRMEPLAAGQRPARHGRARRGAGPRRTCCPSRSPASPGAASTTRANPHLSFLQGGGHGGSHPHLVHEFVSSIVEERKPLDRRRDRRQLDGRRHLRPPVGPAGRQGQRPSLPFTAARE